MSTQPQPTPPAPQKPSIERFKCPGCAADMVFDPQTGGLKCPFCGATKAISQAVNETVDEIPYDEFVAKNDPSKLSRLSEKAVEVSCSTCGAAVQFDPSMMATTCPFCAGQFVAQPKVADPLIAPNGILPFALPKDRATASVKAWLQGLWFAPGDLKKVARPEGINGIYVPYWTFDAQAASSYRGQRGDYYYETETYYTTDSNGQQVRETREVRHTRWNFASGTVANSFDDVLVPATKSIDTGRLHKLEPWDLPAVQPYEPAFLPGFQAQRYQIELPNGLELAKQTMTQAIYHTVCQSIGGDEQRVDAINTQWSGVTFKHLMLPVWIGAYRFQSKVFQVVVNARTGEVQGERPWSGWKIGLLVLAVIVLIWIVVALSKK